jgi:hypothetical protein
MAARVLVAVAVAATAAIVVLYLSIIRSQGGPGEPPSDTPWVVPFVAGYEILMALLLGVSLVVPPAIRPGLRGAASAGLFVLGVLALFSIGLGDIIAAALAAAATVLSVTATHGPRTWVSLAAAAIASVAILLGGFQIAWSHIVCQPTGQSGGSSAGLFGGTAYDCNDGVLTYH